VHSKIWQKFSSASGLRRDFLTGFAWNHAAKIAEYLLLYILSVVVARALGPAANGTYATLVSISQLLLTFSSVTLDLALNRFLPQFSESNGKTAYIVRRLISAKIALLVLLCAALAFGWSVVQRWFDLHSSADIYLAFIIALGFFRAVSSTFAAIWVSRLQSKAILIINSSTLLFQIVAVELVVSGDSGLAHLLMIVLLGALASAVAYLIAGRAHLFVPAEKVSMKPIVSFSGWLWVNAFIAYVYGKQGDIAMLSFFSVKKGLIGLYDVASTLSFLPGFIIAAGLGGISISMFSRLSNEDPSQVKPFWVRLSSFLTQLTIPLYCFLAVFAGNIISVLYSGEYSQSALMVQVFVISRVVARLFGGGESFDALLSLHAERRAVAIGIAGGIINIVLNIVFIPVLQVMGAVLATSITTLVIDGSMWLLLKRRLGVPLLAGNWLRSLLIGGVPVIFMKILFPDPGLGRLMLIGLFCIFVWGFSMVLVKKHNDLLVDSSGIGR
jgi:O-antigen/teichoic acid export membrane protein